MSYLNVTVDVLLFFDEMNVTQREFSRTHDGILPFRDELNSRSGRIVECDKLTENN